VHVANCFAADEKFVDCCPGYVVAAAKNRDGIPTVECKKIWCRDLENGRSMGSGNTAANGYESTSQPVEICDNTNRCLECFGKRKWCPAESTGIFNTEYGIYAKDGADSNMYRGALSGSCYKWQLQNHNCDPNEIAVNNGTSWSCLSQQDVNNGGRNAIKTKAIRRTAIMKKIR
jgi:hypothetical protein